MAVLVSKAALQFLHGNCMPTNSAARNCRSLVILTPPLPFPNIASI